MSIFDYPRINFDGFIALNPGTANNDDHAQNGQVTLPKEYGKYAGEVLGLVDSLLVEPITYGKSDADFIAWAQQAHHFDGSKKKIIPAEWNYYGPQTMYIDGKSNIHGNVVTASVTGVQTGPGQSYCAPQAGVAVSALCSTPLTLSGHITDINSEGSPPATQFFVDNITLDGGQPISGFSKGVGQWLNFYRNINLTADGGAGGYVYHVIPKEKLGNLAPYFTGDKVKGAIFRYYLYRPQLLGDNDTLENQIYPKHETNPAPLQITGTIAPWMEGEDIITAPVGRILTSDQPNIATPTANNNGGGKIALAPAVLQVNGQTVSVDFLGTFPENYQSMQVDDKWNFGPVALYVTNGTATAKVHDVEYSLTPEGNQQGWIFDYDCSANQDVLDILSPNQGRDATFFLLWQTQDENGDGIEVKVLTEEDYYIVTNQSAVYGEQFGSNVLFNNQGIPEPMTVSVYHRGTALTPSNCPPISAWWYYTNPIQTPGQAVLLTDSLKPGEPLSMATDEPGNFLITFGIGSKAGFPPLKYTDFYMPPYVTNSPQISVRILPNNVDFSKYYDDANDPENSANALLTFDVVYRHALRTYYLLYPAMNYSAFQLNDCAAVAQNAPGILHVTDPANWMSISYMPRTRDLSESRRTLLRAWCKRVMAMQKLGMQPC